MYYLKLPVANMKYLDTSFTFKNCKNIYIFIHFQELMENAGTVILVNILKATDSFLIMIFELHFLVLRFCM